jgi:hypothetical protein
VARVSRRKGSGRRSNSIGYVYFVEAPGCGLIKIGHTSRTMAARLMQLKACSPVPLVVLATIVASKDREREIHLRFRESWSHGEWFVAVEELRGYISEHAVAWQGSQPSTGRSLVSSLRLPDGSMPPTSEKLLRDWAEATLLTYFGETRTMAEWSKLMGVNLQRLKKRVDSGLPPRNLFLIVGESMEPAYFAPKPWERKGYRRPTQDGLDRDVFALHLAADKDPTP